MPINKLSYKEFSSARKQALDEINIDNMIKVYKKRMPESEVSRILGVSLDRIKRL